MSEEIFDDQMIKQKELEHRRDSWNEQHESILRQWGEASGCYRYMHHRAFLMYKKLSMRFTLPVIVLSTLTGTANFAQEQFPESVRGMVPSVIGGLNLIAGLIATIMQFLKINELMENHKAAALSYGLLSRNIRLTLALAREERNQDGLDFVNNCKTEYDRLIEQSPTVPAVILVDFEKDPASAPYSHQCRHAAGNARNGHHFQAKDCRMAGRKDAADQRPWRRRAWRRG